MEDELTARYRRWLAADAAGRDDEADAAFGSLFRDTVPEDAVPLEFTAETMGAVSEQAVRNAARLRRTRRVAAVGTAAALAAAVYLGAGYAVSALGTMSLALFNLLVGAVVRTAAGVQAGTDIWGVLGSMGHAASAFVADPKVTFVLLVLQGLALGAFVALQRLLGSDGESWK